jgi:hypothetical protein
MEAIDRGEEFYKELEEEIRWQKKNLM